MENTFWRSNSPQRKRLLWVKAIKNAKRFSLLQTYSIIKVTFVWTGPLINTEIDLFSIVWIQMDLLVWKMIKQQRYRQKKRKILIESTNGKFAHRQQQKKLYSVKWYRNLFKRLDFEKNWCVISVMNCPSILDDDSMSQSKYTVFGERTSESGLWFDSPEFLVGNYENLSMHNFHLFIGNN